MLPSVRWRRDSDQAQLQKTTTDREGSASSGNGSNGTKSSTSDLSVDPFTEESRQTSRLDQINC